MSNKNSVFQEIIVGLSTRDERIQERVYAQFWGYLMGISTRYFKDRNIAREVVNDSFMKAFRTMYDFRHDAGPEEFQKMFRSWLAKITVRTALDKLRANKTILNYVEEYEEQSITYVGVDQELHVQDILKLLYELPEIQRAVFNLYEIEGYSHDEIAVMLTIPASSSRTYLSRAKNKLRELYKNTLIN
ncbi:RNA polymerase sigma factor [Pedobacter antarcticus]|uniref:RNA polymerase sigma factor 70 region 4 type 2 domain-containing protein n=2 Tax=Pedobacter antarcticus TaxID=34086 RepID=A0A081PG30_9SPHI|nr:RNA polymerase sigma factor [Pedobacter antarcticus]KEQ29653.1 hypothetical protein N180_19520 [Pedobacter antarcticus 4BY]SDL78877.1 RNA polymerase sigma-70 factor, ECF subfamily [Pedobacter antarcticus]SFF00140.1 RNA polymerase sigma-70 factor, ECF subfamily [Pedobacter antarcticus]